MFSYIERLYQNAKELLYSNFVNIIKEIHSENDEPPDILKSSRETNIHDFVKTIEQSYISYWRQEIEKSSRLSFYAMFKKDFLLGDHLEIIKDPKPRRIYS